MTKQQFDVIAILINSRGGKSEQAAELVLIRRMSISGAAKHCGIHYNTVTQAVARYAEVLKQIQAVSWII